MKDTELKIGEVALTLRWNRTARVRLSGFGFSPADLADARRVEAATWAVLAAANTNLGTRNLTPEQLLEAAGELEPEEEQAQFAEIAEAIRKMFERSTRPGKPKGRKRASGRSPAGGSG